MVDQSAVAPLDPTSKAGRVLACIKRCAADSGGRATITNHEFRDATGLSGHDIRRALQRLYDDGYLAYRVGAVQVVIAGSPEDQPRGGAR